MVRPKKKKKINVEQSDSRPQANIFKERGHVTQRFQPDDIRFKDGGFGEKGEVENGLNLAQKEEDPSYVILGMWKKYNHHFRGCLGRNSTLKG